MTYVLACARDRPRRRRGGGLSSVCRRHGDLRRRAIPGIIAGLLVGVVVGAINGLLASRVGIPSFLATLAMMGIATGSAMWITGTAPHPDPRRRLHL